MVGYGDTRVLCCVTAAPRPGTASLLPLSVDFEKLYSVGRIPSSFNRREGRPGEGHLAPAVSSTGPSTPVPLRLPQ
ncbi:MAG: hypothetical protein ACLTYN_15115 [Dysosmobacter welbionis]